MICQTCEENEAINDFYGECQDCIEEYANDTVRLMNEDRD